MILVIAMLRHFGYPAKYVRGDILLTEEQAISLTGANTFRQEADVLAANGTPVTRLTRGEETLQSLDLSETYARKRVIKQEEVSYLPLSLQYTVEKESKTFEQIADAVKDRVSFEVNGDVLAGFTASELQGKNILLSFQPAVPQTRQSMTATAVYLMYRLMQFI